MKKVVLLLAFCLLYTPKTTLAQSLDDVQFGKVYLAEIIEERIPEQGDIKKEPSP